MCAGAQDGALVPALKDVQPGIRRRSTACKQLLYDDQDWTGYLFKPTWTEGWQPGQEE